MGEIEMNKYETIYVYNQNLELITKKLVHSEVSEGEVLNYLDFLHELYPKSIIRFTPAK